MSTLREASVDFPAQYLSVSNIVSYASVAAALLAMICASEGRWSVSGMYLGLSVIADMLDGTFANLFSRSERERAFGAQLDSLCDAIAFGGAPVVSAFVVGSNATSNATVRALWIAAALFYLISVITRLGFFNIYSGQAARFIGLPTTMSGLALATIFLFRPVSWVLVIVWL